MIALHDQIRLHKHALALAAKGVDRAREFTLSLPVGFVGNTGGVTTTLDGLSIYLSTSITLSSPEINRFVLLRAEHGFDRAFEICTADETDGEAFCRAWDEAQADLANGALASIDDLVAMVCKARSGWQSDPRELLVVMVEGKRVEHALCPTPWFLR